MERINIGTFSLEAYDETLEKHKDYAKMFENDDDYCTYVGEFWSLSSSVKYDKKQGKYSGIYFAFIGEKLIGMVGLIWILDLPELVIGVLPSMRGRHYSCALYKEYAEYVLETYQEYKALYAHICSENIHSQENALKAGFKRLDEEMYVKKRI